MKQELMAWAASDRHVRPEGRMSGGPDALRGRVFRRTGRFMGVLLLVAPLFLTGLSGCTAGGDYTWGSLYREDVSSVAVPIFTNTTFERGIEFRLTRAVAQQIETRTPWKVTDRRSADTILEGEIISVGSQPISRDRFTTLPQEQLFTIRMNLLLKDLRTGQILMERRDYEQSVPYYPTLGEGTFTGQQESVERLAVAIVRELESDW